MSFMTFAVAPRILLTRASATKILLALTFAITAFATSAALLPTNADAAFAIKSWKLTPSSTQAGGHPNSTFAVGPDAAANDRAGDDLKSVLIDFPAGYLVVLW